MENPGKIALVTGASRGLGKNAAIALSKKGINVIVTYHSKKEEALEVVAAIEKNGASAIALQLDVSNTKSFDQFAQQLTDALKTKWNRNNFDFLVNNAGFGINASFADTTEEDFDSLMNVHVKGVFFLTQKLLPLVADHGGIINFSTGLTRFTGQGFAAYAAMKGAVEVFTKYLAKEVGVRGIRANVIAPGPIDTDFHHRSGAHPNMEGFKKAIGLQTALGRMGEPDDIGGVVASLCADEMKWVNAQRIEVSGGAML